MGSSKQIRRITTLAMFLALSVLLHYLESLLPVIVPIPGVKLGLANTMGLIVLYFFNRRDFVATGFLRVMLVGLLTTGIFTSGFFISFSGWLLSTLIVLLLSNFKFFSIYSLSACSAIFHGIGQVACSAILYSSIYMMAYTPIIVLSGLITGILVAFLSSLLINQLEKTKLFIN